MRIDSLTPAFSGPADSLEMQAENRRIVQAVRILNSSQQLANAKRLGYIVISAEIQSHHFVDLLALGGEHQDGGRDFF